MPWRDIILEEIEAEIAAYSPEKREILEKLIALESLVNSERFFSRSVIYEKEELIKMCKEVDFDNPKAVNDVLNAIDHWDSNLKEYREADLWNHGHFDVDDFSSFATDECATESSENGDLFFTLIEDSDSETALEIINKMESAKKKNILSFDKVLEKTDSFIADIATNKNVSTIWSPTNTNLETVWDPNFVLAQNSEFVSQGLYFGSTFF